MWDAATARKTYLPRLGGPLAGLACCPEDPAKYAIRQVDNTIRVVSMLGADVKGGRQVLRVFSIA
jgi:hypothetical protein